VKIFCVIPIYGRTCVTAETVARLYRQTIPVEVILVGSLDEDRQLADLLNVHYIHSENAPLGAKTQRGVDRARELGADILMCCGSDDWVSYDWCEFFLQKFLEGYNFTATLNAYFIKCMSGRSFEVRWRKAYEGTYREGEPIGPGRMISKELLDRVDWKLYPPERVRFLDGISFKRCKGAGGRFFLYEGHKVYVWLIKGDWVVLDSWEFTRGSYLIKSPEKWLSRIDLKAHGVLRTLRKLGGKDSFEHVECLRDTLIKEGLCLTSPG
jgi:glycosyltransferase involved in cell wall biosynthesis